MRQVLRLVETPDQITGEDILSSAAAGVGCGNAAAVLDAGERLARQTAGLVRQQQDGSLLASVVCVIQDQRLKVAYLEAIGSYLK